MNQNIHTQFPEDIELAKRHRLFDNSAFLNHAETYQTSSLSRQVAASVNKEKRAIRLSLEENAVLYARISPLHHIEDILVEQLSSEFPRNIILLESKKGCFLGSKSIGRVISINEKGNKIIEKIHEYLEGG